MTESKKEKAGRARVARFWQRIEAGLTFYYWRCCAVKLCNLRYREGWYLCIAGLVLVALTWLALNWLRDRPWIPAVVAAYYVVDSLLVNTWITFITRSPINHLRSIVLTLSNVANIGIAFAVLHAAQDRCGFSASLTPAKAVYFSFATMMTIGYGDIVPISDLARLTVVLQVLVGLYFLAAIVTTVVQWAQEETDGGQT